MKPVTPNDPLDDLIVAALHGELTPEERAQFDSRLATDPAAQSAYQEAQAMHDLLEKTHQSAQPDAAFEQRMVSGVRRKLQTEQHRETAWESAVVLWKAISRVLSLRAFWAYSGVCSLVLVCGLTFLIVQGNQVKSVFTTITSQLAVAGTGGYIDAATSTQVFNSTGALNFNNARASKLAPVDLKWNEHKPSQIMLRNGENAYLGSTTITGGTLSTTGSGQLQAPRQIESLSGANTYTGATTITAGATTITANTLAPKPQQAEEMLEKQLATAKSDEDGAALPHPALPALPVAKGPAETDTIPQGGTVRGAPFQPPTPETPAADDRKLIRNAQLDLEVKSYQDAIDQVTALTKSAGGYVDTSNSQRGGNGKLQGTVVVKVLPQNLDAFLLKLRDLGQVKNQSVSTDDVTKDYFDTQARLANSQKMEVQLQELLKRENGKVSDLLAVERELGRVRGDIEQMQGQLKLYDFQVQYATVTMQIAEKDLKQTAAYLLKEQDDFSLFATDVEGTFQTARKTADDFKAQVLVANLNHNSGSDVSAMLVVSVPPDQIEPFLAQIRGLGRVANFTRDTKRIAKDGGDSDQPADQTLTEKDKVMVNISIRSDDETRKQVAMTVVTKAVDEALDQAKSAAMAQAGTAIISSSLNKAPQGQSTAQLNVRVPGKEYAALMDAFRSLGRTASLSVQRNDNAGPGANGDDAPVIVSLALTDDDTPLQTTQMSVLGSDVDSQSQQIKKDAAAAGVEVKSSNFARQPDGTEMAQLTFRLPLSKYAAFMENLKKLGNVESLTVQRDDRPDETITDESAPAEINLELHNQRDIVADDNGIFATLRHTFGEGADALFASVRIIGVLIAFILPWVVTLAVIAWIARRIYIWRKK